MQQNFYKHAMTFGLILGVAFSVNFFLSIPGSALWSLLSYFVVGAIVYLTYRFACNYRDTEQAGAISYGRSLWYIVVLYIFASIISSAVKYVYWEFINPEFLPNQLDATMQLMEQMQLPVAEDLMYDQLSAMMTPANFALQYVWVNTLLGFLLALVMAAFVKKEKSIFEE